MPGRQASGRHEHTQFTFLGFTFRARKARATGGGYFTSFLPAISTEALKAKGADLRWMRIHRHADLSLDDLEKWLNPIVAGWMNYYGQFYWTVMDRAASTRARPVRPLEVGPRVLTAGERSGRLSRRDLREPGGAIPPGHPTAGQDCFGGRGGGGGKEAGRGKRG